MVFFKVLHFSNGAARGPGLAKYNVFQGDEEL